jgi:RHS repeat-associated protein
LALAEDESTSNPEAASEAVELPGKRTATSNTFALSDGTLETRLFQTPVNYRDEDGDWQPIEQELQETASGAVTNGDNNFDVYLPEELDQAPIRVSVDGEWVSEALIGLDTEPAELQADGVASYADESAGASLDYAGLANGLKETINLSDPSAPATYHFKLEASAGVTPTLLEDGSIAFRDEDENLVAEMPAPTMVDSADAAAPADAVRYSLESDGPQSWRLTVEADPAWLSSPDRSFPAEIDPTLTISAPELDCTIASFDTLSRCGSTGSTNLVTKVNYVSSGADEYARTLLQFNLSAIPKTASFTSATIGLNSAKEAKNWTELAMLQVSKQWNNTVDWIGSGGTPDPWSTPGGDFNGSVVLVTPTSRGGSQPGPWVFSSESLTWLAQRWLDGITPNYGVGLKLTDEKSHTCTPSCIERRIEWESSTAAAGKKPYLSIQYVDAASADSKVSSPTDGTKTAKRFLLTSAWEHSGVSGIAFQYKAEQGWKDIPASQVIDSNNQTVTWPYSVPKPEDRASRPLYWDATGLAEKNFKAKFQIRAVLSGSAGAGGYTKPVDVEIDRDIGGPKDGIAPVGPGSVDLLTGNFTISRTDVSIPAFNSTLEFSRSFNSRASGVEATGVLGPGWKPAAPLEEAGGSAWSKLQLNEETENFEGETETYKWATLIDSEGGELAFEEVGGQFITPPEMSGYVLYRNPSTGNIEFTGPDGNKTVFSNGGSGNEYLPISIAMTGGPGNKSRMIYKPVGGNRRLDRIVAPAAPGVECPDEGSETKEGCRVLAFTYENAKKWGAPESAGSRLWKITYYAGGYGGPWDVAQYSYNSNGQLASAWDPRISPTLNENYTYNGNGQIGSLTPPGQQSWQMEYRSDEGSFRGRLKSVIRSSSIEKEVATTTIAYGVPLSGGSGRPDLQGAAVATWGQQDIPTDATAIFPPTEVPSDPPSSYTRASLYYMDAEGQISNVATPAGAGTSSSPITTTETDRFGNVVRELSAEDRLRALAAGAGSVAKSQELDTQYRYSTDGTELQEEKGPTHQVRLESGTTKPARMYRSIQYDANFKYLNGTTTPSPGETKPHLPTTETTGALLADGSIVDKRSTEYRYEWKLRKTTETISDPGGSEETKSVNVYDETSGLTTEIRQPKNAAGGGAGTTKVVYYKAGAGSSECESNRYAGLVCKIGPAAQPGTAGQPELPVRKVVSYNQLGQPLENTESPGGKAENVRKSVLTYDAAGRRKTSEIIGGGTAVPRVETLYSASQGLPTTQQIVCPGSEPGCDTQATMVTYDSYGRPTVYKDADGNEAKTTYDFLGRPTSINDGKGTQTLRYDSVRGLLVELEDSAAGLFTASYDADGQQIKRVLPNGLTAETTYDEAGSPVGLTYIKASNCGASCNWLNFSVERSIQGQILLENGTLGKDEYGYDKLGRLTSARETPTGGTCITRSYKYDKDSNREEMTTTPGIGGACSSSGGTTQKYSYDSADRLLATSLNYDSWGRITNLPSTLAGGKPLSTTYFSNDMVATQTQGNITNRFQLDATLRPRQRLQDEGLEGIEIFHYTDSGDSPAWTIRGSTWTRSIGGIGGELAAIQESGKEVELQLTNMHGDVSATAALSPTVTALKGTFTSDEFGNPTSSGSAGRFGWLGGKRRRTELASGVIQMGARSYVPSLGRFLTPDPILGGSANPYDYANQDPINNFDLTGEECESPDSDWQKRCRRINRKIERRTNKVIRRTRKVERAFDRLKARMESQKSGFAPDFGWFEDQINSVIHREQSIVDGARHAPCGKAATGAYSGGYFMQKVAASLAADYPEFATIVAGIGGAAEGLGATLGAGSAAGLC